MKDGKHITLAIESSCDETSVALVADGREVLSNIISSQIDIHTLYGGVVPEIASRHHLTNINAVTDEAFAAAGVTPDEVDLIGVTKGPGLIGALLIGGAADRRGDGEGLCARMEQTARRRAPHQGTHQRQLHPGARP